MPESRRALTFDDVANIAADLPGVTIGKSYGTPALHVKKKFMARLRDDDPDVMVLKPVYDDEQKFLMQTRPGVFFTTDHYRGYPTILIRLSRVDPAQLRDLVRESWPRLAPARLVAEYDAMQPAKPLMRSRAPARKAAKL